MEHILKYFPDLTIDQADKFYRLKDLYFYWNSKINIISRKDIEHFYERHVLHSLSIGKLISFVSNTSILDAGTGGGFPGIPLAILFPNSSFCLIDSIGKKIKVVNSVISELGLVNVEAEKMRAEDVPCQFEFIVSRAVTYFPDFLKLVKHKISHENKNNIKNGILYLKGGEIMNEIKGIDGNFKIVEIKNYFEETFFETKKIICFSY